MSISAPFIARPIATSLLAIAVLLAGALGYRALPVSALPQVDFPTILVTTQLPGANPDTVATLVTASLERQFGQIQGLTSMTSTSSEGTSQITLQFSLSRSIDSASEDVQAAINAAAGTLPVTLPYPPVYAKVNPADAPILTLALLSDAITIDRVSDAADTLLQPKLSQIEGVGRVTVQGNMRPAVRVRVDPARLAAYGLAHGGRAQRRRRRQRQRRQGRLRRPAPGLCAWRQRPDHLPGRLRHPGHRLSQRRAGAPVRRRHRGRRGGEQPRRRLVLPAGRRTGPCRGDPRHPAASPAPTSSRPWTG